VTTGFVTGGTWCVDRNCTVEFWPGEDTAATVGTVELAVGGSGANFAIDMRRLDPTVAVETIGVVGDDDPGRFLFREADRAGVGRSRLQVSAAAPTQVTDAFTSARSGRRTHLIYEGAGALLSPSDFDFAGLSGWTLHLGLPGIHRAMDAAWGGEANGWVAVLKAARRAGLSTNLELVTVPAGRLAALAGPCLPFLDSLVVNDHEVGALTGRATVRDGVADPDACRVAVDELLDAGAMEVVVAHHVGGAVLAARDGSRLAVPSVAVPEAEIRGANGAGDAFAAGFLWARRAGHDAETCLRTAHAVAAASLRAVTTVGGVGPVAECLALAARWGWR